MCLVSLYKKCMYVCICTLTIIFISASVCTPWVHTDTSDLNPKPHSSFYFSCLWKIWLHKHFIYFYLHSPQYSEAAKMDVFLGFIWFELIRIPNFYKASKEWRQEPNRVLFPCLLFLCLFLNAKTTNRNAVLEP